jgi:hypothetical protein
VIFDLFCFPPPIRYLLLLLLLIRLVPSIAVLVHNLGLDDREFYKDDDDIIFKYKREIGFNGITLAANLAYLFDRSFIVEIEVVTDETRRLLESDILPELKG